MGRQSSPTNVTGVVSLENFTLTPLGANQTYDGTFEDVKDVAMLSITVKSDKDSASKGLKFQWSIDGTEVDFEDATDVSASALLGRAFSITPRARFFRIAYVNGAIAQTKFRLGVVYHSAGTGLISRPLDRLLTDNQFAQTVRSVTVGKKTNGEYTNILASDDGHLIINAVLYGVKDDGSIIPINVTNDGKLKVKTF